MKIKIAISILTSLLLLVISSSFLKAQTCPENGLFFNYQSQIDTFPSLYPACTTIKGSVYIDNGFGGDITNLDSLRQITTIEGSLNLFYLHDLQDFSGLEQLETITEQLYIQLNPKLKNLSHLESLTSLGGLLLAENDSLINLEGLNQVKQITGTIQIRDNVQLSNLKGLESLEHIGGTLIINDNDTLKNLTGLERLKTVDNLRIYSNPLLETLGGLDSLESILKDFDIAGNNQLLNLIGLSSLKFIGSDFVISENPELIDLSGFAPTSLLGLESLHILSNNSLSNLDGLKYFDLKPIQSITIVSNYDLDQCAVNSVCDYLSICKNIVIETNGESCENLEGLESQCELLSNYNFQWHCPVRLFPNPSNDYLNVRIYSKDEVGSIDYEIRDIAGRLLIQGRQSGERLDVSTLAAGAYFLTIMTDLQTEVQRFVKI